ncbi:hypothetical protein FACS1894195_2150 [Bacteroidia bacterium]|nr:hypothetical protein FACS1894195_2150 [Bacteroidia bacterium]
MKHTLLLVLLALLSLNMAFGRDKEVAATGASLSASAVSSVCRYREAGLVLNHDFVKIYKISTIINSLSSC